MKAIDVITSINAEGVITPIRARIEENEEIHAFDLKLISRERVGKFIRFKCKAIINGYSREIELRFYSQDTIWYMV